MIEMRFRMYKTTNKMDIIYIREDVRKILGFSTSITFGFIQDFQVAFL